MRRSRVNDGFSPVDFDLLRIVEVFLGAMLSVVLDDLQDAHLVQTLELPVDDLEELQDETVEVRIAIRQQQLEVVALWSAPSLQSREAARGSSPAE